MRENLKMRGVSDERMTHRNESGRRREATDTAIRKMFAVYYTYGAIQGFAPSSDTCQGDAGALPWTL